MMKRRLGLAVTRRSRGYKPLASRWASFFGAGAGGTKAWTCTFCGVNGSHRSGCHYVTEAHHRGRKAVRRGVVGARNRASRRRGPAHIT